MEKQEHKILAPYAMKNSDSLGRSFTEKEHPYRTAFQRDRDRIIHSTAFRRMEYKTQVFVNHEGDHYRTRLTHTIEVTQIARSIGRALRLNEDLIETIALAHDLGHTPFGHAGEEALNELMKNDGGFEHNAQGLRVIELLERRYPQFPGLNLSYEVRESLAKHATAYDHSEANPDYHPEWQALLEAQVVAMADAIAYNNHDLDDGIRAGLIKDWTLKECVLWRKASEKHEAQMTPDEKEKYLRPQSIITLINLQVTDLVKNTVKLLKRHKIRNLNDVKKHKERLVRFSDQMAQENKALEKFLYENVYRHFRVEKMSQKSKRFLQELFAAYLNDPKQLSPRYQQWAKDSRCDQIAGRRLKRSICDYISGMTDRYAQEEYKKLFYPFEKI